MIRCVPTPAWMCDDRNASITLYDPRGVNRIFTFSDWTARYCYPAVACKLDSPWLSPYLFVSLCGWAICVEVQPDIAMLTVGYSPDDIAPMTCPDLPINYPVGGSNRRCFPDFARRSSDLMAVAIQLSSHRGV